MIALESALQCLPAKALTTGHAKHSNAIREAKEIQQHIMNDIRNPKLKASDRASSARSWVLVQGMIQELRGIPKPGQYRPDLDPVQLARALKRQKSRGILDISESPHEAPDEDAEPTSELPPNPAPETETPTPENLSKESLLTGQTVPTVSPPGEDLQGTGLCDRPLT